MAKRLTFEESAVRNDLKFWGFHNGKFIAWEGYSPENTVARLLEGWGGGFEHRVLMQDLPERVAVRWWPIHGKVMRLPAELRAVLIARYCVPPKVREDGKLEYHNRKELAAACGISRNEFERRLGAAKNRYQRMVFPDRAFYCVAVC